MSEVQLLNYSTRAIEDILEMVERLPRRMHATQAQLRRTTELLGKAIKFLLPERGDLIDFKRVDEAALDMLHLPFPLIALEIPFPPEGTLIASGPLKETLSSRRIALVWDESFAPQSGLAPDYRETGIYVIALYYTDDERKWTVSPVGLFMPRDTEIRKVSEGHQSESEKVAIAALLAQDAINLNSPVLGVRYFDVLPEMKQLLVAQIGPVDAQARMEMDVRDEMLCTWGFCLTVNCVNIRQAQLTQPEKLNAKRVRAGKPPLYEYRVLELPEPRPAGVAHSRLDGARQGPRAHLRRGHPRRLSDGRVTYVRAALVGAGNPGVVQKDYRVGAGA